MDLRSHSPLRGTSCPCSPSGGGRSRMADQRNWFWHSWPDHRRRTNSNHGTRHRSRLEGLGCTRRLIRRRKAANSALVLASSSDCPRLGKARDAFSLSRAGQRSRNRARPIASMATDRRFLTSDGLTLRAGQAPRRYVGGARIVLMQGRE